jgi:hypothetical protein
MATRAVKRIPNVFACIFPSVIEDLFAHPDCFAEIISWHGRFVRRGEGFRRVRCGTLVCAWFSGRRQANHERPNDPGREYANIPEEMFMFTDAHRLVSPTLFTFPVVGSAA